MARKAKREGWWSKYGVTVISIVITAIVTSVGTLLVSDYVNHASSNREQIALHQKSVEDTERQVSQLLQKFSDKAIGKGDVTEADYAELKTLLLRLTEEARSLSQRLPSTEPVYIELTDAMIELRNAAGEMTGPLDAKPFVQALADYYKYQFMFDQAVVRAYQDYKLPFMDRPTAIKTASPST